ncbi:ester cyclase [Streptomyces spirodelae]|uniref:Ester cyclase n=1 Tax=Streptomyces spirodelae TaxID=2812904 RepID=A0ABS3WPU9_9ACTN|nr:ester cyclase [Streptomyces spirodelae]MBO8185146.1 ester cyclase [Streptomyces spirodelae]
MPHAESRRALIRSVWEATWNRGDVDALDELLSSDYLRHSSEPHPQNLRTFKASILATRSAFPDLSTTLDDILIEGDRAAIRWHSTGNHEGSLMGVPATKRRVEVGGATFARFEEDRIVEEFVTWDPRALLSALGIIHVGQDRPAQ